MKATNFMMDNSDLAGMIFSNANGLDRKNRLFRLQQGESINIRTNIEEQDYLYLLRGEAVIEFSGKSVSLGDTEKNSVNVFNMPQQDVLVSLTAIKNTVIYHVDGKRLDDIVTWVGIAQTLEDEPERLSILAKVLKTKSLTSLPVESVFELISNMQVKSYNKGDVVVNQGDAADHFYILHSGQAEVWSLGLYDDEPQQVGMLVEGDCFGEDALVTGGTRNATVKMHTDGELLVADHKDFMRLIANPSIEEIDADLTQIMMKKEGYQLLDVRYEEEHEDSYIEGCNLIPLHELRNRFSELDTDKKYITYCRSGKRSAVAALILKQRKYNVVSMRGGINQWPFDTRSLY